MKKAYYNTRPGVSLLISLLLVGILVLFGLIVSNLVVSSIRESANINRANQSFYAAEGALEEGLLINQQKGPGYTDSAPVSVTFASSCPPGSPCGSFLGDLTAQYKIQGQVPDTFHYDVDDPFGVPMPGTGNAGSDCNTVNPFVSGSFYYSAASEPHYVSDASGLQGYIGPFPVKDQPCNWNKIAVGETVSIPLYVTVPDPQNPGQTKILNPGDPDFDLTSLKILVRTPCSFGEEFCDPMQRQDLDTSSGDPNVNFDDTTILWQIYGTSLDGTKGYGLGARTDYDFNFNIRKLPQNSEIYEGRINKTRQANNVLPCGAIRFCSINQQNLGKDQDGKFGSLLAFITDKAPFLRSGNNIINAPTLKLTVIHGLKSSLGATIPYLEYQILLDNNKNLAPANILQNISAEASIGSFKQVLEVQQPQENGLLEYVIQQ